MKSLDLAQLDESQILSEEDDASTRLFPFEDLEGKDATTEDNMTTEGECFLSITDLISAFMTGGVLLRKSRFPMMTSSEYGIMEVLESTGTSLEGIMSEALMQQMRLDQQSTMIRLPVRPERFLKLRTTEHMLYSNVIGKDLIVQLAPVSEFTMKGKLVSITRATPNVVEPEDTE